MSFSYQVQHASLEWDAQGLPFAAGYQDVYYSRHDPLGESSHVFLQGNRLPERFAALVDEPFIVVELGFGAGLNFLNTCRQWCHSAPETATLHYVACELHPLRTDDLRRLHAQFPELDAYAWVLQAWLPKPCSGVHQLQLRFGSHRVVLSLYYGPAAELPACLAAVPGLQVDAWYLDGFAPACNPGMWAGDLFRALAPFCHADSTLSSYSVAGHVRRALGDAGFACEKLPGFAGKRHMLRATLPGAPPRSSARRKPEDVICVVGAGLAGCSTARLLAERGWRVLVLEAAPDVAAGASGNPQGVLHFKPATVDAADNRFNLHAYLHAAREYASLGLPPDVWSPCGMLQLAHDARLQKRFTRLASGMLYPPGIFEVLDARQASSLAGLALQQGALYLPDSGWLSPAALCRWYLQHPGIAVRCGTRLQALMESGTGWTLELATAQGQVFVEARHVVLCNAEAIHDLEQTRHIPVICNRGQVDVYKAEPGSGNRPVICSQGYCIPAGPDAQLSIGGSFSLAGDSPAARAADTAVHRAQLAATSEVLATAFSSREPVQQRRATRCTLADRMPVVGHVSAGQSGRSLWVNAAHGSQGLARTPLSAAWLLAQIDCTPSPLDATLAGIVAPERFPRQVL